jgi:hypothetical protein
LFKDKTFQFESSKPTASGIWTVELLLLVLTSGLFVYLASNSGRSSHLTIVATIVSTVYFPATSFDSPFDLGSANKSPPTMLFFANTKRFKSTVQDNEAPTSQSSDAAPSTTSHIPINHGYNCFH